MREKIIRVYCKTCQEWMDESDGDLVEYIDIWEGDRGQDIMEFRCVNCGTINESCRR